MAPALPCIRPLPSSLVHLKEQVPPLVASPAPQSNFTDPHLSQTLTSSWKLGVSAEISWSISYGIMRGVPEESGKEATWILVSLVLTLPFCDQSAPQPQIWNVCSSNMHFFSGPFSLSFWFNTLSLCLDHGLGLGVWHWWSRSLLSPQTLMSPCYPSSKVNSDSFSSMLHLFVPSFSLLFCNYLFSWPGPSQDCEQFKDREWVSNIFHKWMHNKL